MLIYNHNKTLVGIDQESLQQLGYKTLSTFLEEHKDVAELFVKKPGYIHNFQNFPWIDFVLHADAEDTKAIIETKTTQFSCNISIEPIFLSDAPDQEGYTVLFKHVKSLGGAMPRATTQDNDDTHPAMDDDHSDDPFGLAIDAGMEATVLTEPDTFDIPEISAMDLPDINPDGSLNAPDAPPPVPDQKQGKPMLGDYINKEEKVYLDKLQTAQDYRYDPHIAADELGLPVELIEEFIGDFIKQANDFKQELFDATLKEDFDEIHILSHKLKGVAANLRIEDAFEVLSIVNGSHDQVESEANLKQFYRIVAKMEGKEVPDFTELDTETDDSVPLDLNDDDLYDIGSLLGDSGLQNDDFMAAPVERKEESLDFDDDLFASETSETDMPVTLDDDTDLFDDITTTEDTPLTQEIDLPETAAADTAQTATPAPLQYDRRVAASQIGLKEAFVHDLVDEFKDDALVKTDAIHAAIDSNELKRIKPIAFELKGIADNLRIEQISSALADLLHSRSTDEASAAADQFKTLVSQL